MKFQRGFTRFVAVLTTISLLLPTAVFALSTAVQPTPSGASSASAHGSTSRAAVSTLPSITILQAQDLFGLLNGEVGGIPQFGLAADVGLSRWTPASLSAAMAGENQNPVSRVASADISGRPQYTAQPISAPASAALPDVALVDGAGSDILLKADQQASAAFKLTSPTSLPHLVETQMQALTSEARFAGAAKVRNLLDLASAAPAKQTVSPSSGSAGSHRFGTVLSGLKPTVGAAPFAREWALVVFGSFTSELVLRLGTAPEGTLTSAPPTWVAVWLELMIGLAGLAALSRALRGDSTRQTLLVILKREQRE